MKIRLRRKWTDILKKAWSVRFTVLAGLFSTAEAVVPLFVDDLPRGVFITLTFISIMGALVTRVISQENLSND